MNTVNLKLSEPVTVAMASPDVRYWGPYQFTRRQTP